MIGQTVSKSINVKQTNIQIYIYIDIYRYRLWIFLYTIGFSKMTLNDFDEIENLPLP